jgi:hypothetical protein
MTEDAIPILKESSGKQLEIHCKDGEVMEIKIISVSESERDVVYDLVSTNRPERYIGQNTKATSYLTTFDEIDTVTPRPTDAIS